MRRMNSMLLGHHGASGRTDCMYFWIASRVAGSSHESGRWTMRLGIVRLCRSGSSDSAISSSVEKLGPRQNPGVVMNLQRPDAGSQVDDPGNAFPLEPGEQFLDAEPEVEVEDRFAVFDQQVPVALGAAHSGRAGFRG